MRASVSGSVRESAKRPPAGTASVTAAPDARLMSFGSRSENARLAVTTRISRGVNVWQKSITPQHSATASARAPTGMRQSSALTSDAKDISVFPLS